MLRLPMSLWRIHTLPPIRRFAPWFAVCVLALALFGPVVVFRATEGSAAPTDLVVAVTGDGVAVAGGVAEFRVVARNAGGGDSTEPIGLTLSASGSVGGTVSGSGEGWTCPADVARCTSSDAVAAGESAPVLLVRVPVRSGYPAGGTVRLSVQLDTGSDAVAANNSAAASVPVVRASSADLAVAVAGRGLAVAGGEAEFDLVVRNVGGADSVGLVEVALVPSGALAGDVTGSGAGWSCPTGTARCTRPGSVPAGASAPVLTVRGPVQRLYPVFSAAGLSAQVIGGADGVDQNNSANASMPVVQSSGVDLVATASALGTVTAGETASFRLVVANAGGAASAGAVTVAVQPSGSVTGAVTASGDGWSCPQAANECVRSGAVPAGGSLPPLMVRVDTTEPGRVGIDAGVRNHSDGVDRNNDVSASTSVLDPGDRPDLGVAVSGGEPLRSGQRLSVTAAVTNGGQAAASGAVSVQLGVPLPGAAATGDRWVCTRTLACVHPGPVAAGRSLPPITVRADTSPTDATSRLTVTASMRNDSEANAGNNDGHASVGVGGVGVDLAVAMGGLAPIRTGEPVTFSARVSNAGTAASNGDVSVQLYAPFTDASAAGAGWTCTTSLACVHPGPVPAGGTLPDITVTTAVPPGYVYGVAASASVTNDSDAHTGNNTTSIATAAGGVPTDLTVRLGGGGALTAGNRTTFTAHVSNSGTAASAGEVTVLLYAPFPDAAATGAGWTCTTGLACTHPGPVPAGGSLPEISLAVSVPADVQPSVTTLSAYVTNDSDANAGNNGTDTNAPVANRSGGGRLVVTVAASTNLTKAGALVDVTVTVANPGATALAGPTRLRLSPSFGLVVQAIGGTGWTCEPGSDCTWPLGLEPGGATTLSAQVRVSDSPPDRVFVTATASDASTAALTTSRTLPINVRAHGVDLVASVAADGAAPADGRATFRVTARNVGGATASARTELMLAPSGAVSGAVQSSGKDWSCPQGTSRCVYAKELAPGRAAPDLTVSYPVGGVYPGNGGVFLNTRVENPADSVPDNDSAGARTPVTQASGVDLAVSVAGDGLAVAKGAAEFRVVVRNVGGADATGPVDVALNAFGVLAGVVSGAGAGWSCPAGAYRCTRPGGMAAGESLPELVVRVPVGSTYPNGSIVGLAAVVSGSSDGLAQNNSASASTPLVRASSADLVVGVAGTGTAAIGGSAEFRVVVRNVGYADSAGPVDVALAPSGHLVGEATASGDGWSCPAGAFRCTHPGGVAAGGIAAAPAGPFAGVAVVSG